MRKEIREAASTITPLPLAIGNDQWDLFIFGVVRVGPELFVQVAAVGPGTCTATATVRVDSRRGRLVAAREVIALVRNWLTAGDIDRHGFLEQASCAAAS